MKPIKYALAIALLASSTAFSYGFKGIEAGAKIDVELLKSKISGRDPICIESVSGPGFYCKGKTTIVERDAELSVNLDPNYIVEHISVKFDPSTFGIVKTALIDKYGKPKSDEIETIQNGMGAVFKQNTVSWDHDGDVMILTKYRNTVTESELFIASKAGMAEAHKSVQKSKGDI